MIILLCPICGEDVCAESGEVRCPMCGHQMAVLPERTQSVNYAGDPVPEGFDRGCLGQLAIIAAILAANVWLWWVLAGD